MSLKRLNNNVVLAQEAKRWKNDLVSHTNRDKILTEVGVRRTSNLQAPIMLLEGHGGEILASKFHPQGEVLLSSGFDRQIYLWQVYGNCENIMALSGHTGAIMEAHFTTDGMHIFTCSTDRTLAIWDVTTGQRVRRLKGHSNFVNSIQGTRRGEQLLCSGSDDRTIRVWDVRKKLAVKTLDENYQMTAVCFNDTGDQVISGGIDNELKIWDLRTHQVLHNLCGHSDTITGIALSPDGSFALTNAMDNTLRIWDIRPYVAGDRCIKIFHGHQHNFEKNLLRCAWSPSGDKVSCGSSDRQVYIWDVAHKRVLYKLPGHGGSVNDVDFSAKEPIILSGSSDKTLFLGEIED